jgi:hypothetical protein
MSWTKIDIKEPIVFKSEGTWYKIKIIKNIKGKVMCEVERFGTTIMRSMDKLPADVQAKLQTHIPVA